MTPIEILEQTITSDVKPALGCTEPITIALAACNAYRVIEGEIELLDVTVSTNLFKNAMEVGIPGTGGRTGIRLAAALGCLSPQEKPDLTLLDDITDEWLVKANQLVNTNKVKLSLANKVHGLMVEVKIKTNESTSRAIIKDSHENLCLLEKDSKIIFEKVGNDKATTDKLLLLRQQLSEQNFSDIWENVSKISDKTRKYLLSGIDMNLKVSNAGMGKDAFLKIGNVYNELINEGWLGSDVLSKAKAVTSAAVDARMSGCSLPVMTSAGSGNQGITITLPIHVLAQHLKCNEKRVAEALAISHAITSILKHHTGTLSAMCGCVVCSGTGLTAGIIYLMNGDLKTATEAVNNMVGSITGIICDGAKVGCAIKLICAVDAAYQSALMAIKGLKIPATNGVLADNLEQSLENIGRIAAPGMIETDDQILSIMLGKPI